jgi:hypothetical protein
MRLSRDIWFYYHGLGDSLLFNAVVHALGEQNRRRYLIGTSHPEIYAGNRYALVLPFCQRANYKLGRFFAPVVGLKAHHIDYYYEGHPPKRHILSLLSDRVGLHRSIQRPEIFLSAEEKAKQLLPETGSRWVAIQSTGLTRWTDNKNWGVERFREVVQLLQDRVSIVQLGAENDPSLGADLELQGKLPIRDVFVALRQCQVFIGQVGFLMHAAAAVRLPSVIVYGGFEATWQSGYEQNINLYSDVECAPCWLETKCPHDKKCMSLITPERVAAEAVDLLE